MPDSRDYEVWFRAEVEQALREADDANVQRIPNVVVMDEMERECAELLKHISLNGQ